MPLVFIPPSLRQATNGQETVEVSGRSVRQAIDSLEAIHAGIKEQLCQDGELRPGLSVVVDGSVSSLGLLQAVDPKSEIHFLPAIGGG
jgi:molybdopterin synthase sulfur carrier subunit